MNGKQTYPKLPISVDEAIIYQLSNLQKKNVLGSTINWYVDGWSFCIFNYNYCAVYFGDSKFNYAPKYFIQLYTIHGRKNGYYLSSWNVLT